NTAHHFTITKYHESIQVFSRALVDTHPIYPRLDAVTDRVPLSGFPYPLRDFLQLGGPVRPSAALRKLNRAIRVPGGTPLGLTVRLVAAHIGQTFTYRKHVTRYDSTTEDFLRLRAGVCQDFTHLMLGCLRLRGIPCRYVSGILHVRSRRDEPAQSHAWVEFHSPSHGWVAYDPTHTREVDERYVTVAHGRHYDDVPPNKGIYRGNAGETLATEVHTRPSEHKGVSTLHEEIQQIDLPVYQEIPERRADRAALLLAEEAAAQQQ
ncbi:MAG TPA: transglutaminase family protein, partial [Methylomirabilota bacterium]|nr:transglutaminase family protein [Methylomirabilota bacterium]